MQVLTLYLIEIPFNVFANKADADQTALTSCLTRVYSVCLWKYDISDPTLVDLASISSMYQHESSWERSDLVVECLRGRGFEPHRHHCVVVLEQDAFIPA